MREEGRRREPSGSRSAQVERPEGSVFNPHPTSLIPHPASLVPTELAQHCREPRRIAAERLEEFLIGALDEMDELPREATTRGGWSQRVGARVARVIGATHELFSFERSEHLRGRHRVGARVACEHDLRHRLTVLRERRDAGEEHHLQV